jgi:hypothetical protein
MGNTVPAVHYNSESHKIQVSPTFTPTTPRTSPSRSVLCSAHNLLAAGNLSHVIHIQPYHLDHGDSEQLQRRSYRRTLSFSFCSKQSSRDPLYRACLTSYEPKQGAEALQRFVTLTCALSAAVENRSSIAFASFALDRLVTSLSRTARSRIRSTENRLFERDLALVPIPSGCFSINPDAASISRAFSLSTGSIHMAILSL